MKFHKIALVLLLLFLLIAGCITQNSTDSSIPSGQVTNFGNSRNIPRLESITIYNNNIGESLRDYTNPLWPKAEDCLTERCITGRNAKPDFKLLAGLPTTTQGYGYANVRFNGWTNKGEHFTTFTVGEGTTGSAASTQGIVYKDNTGIEHKVPFYYTLSTSSSGGSSFTLDGATFYYKVNTTDVNFNLTEGSVLNGYRGIVIRDGNDFTLNTDRGPTVFTQFFRPKNVDLGEVNYTCTKIRMPLSLTCTADANISITTNGYGFASTPTDLITHETIYLDDGNLINKTGNNVRNNIIQITSTIGMNNQAYMYVPYINETQGTVYLLLARQNITNTENSNSYTWSFLGTDTGEDGIVDRAFYWPDLGQLPRFEGASASNGQTTTRVTTHPSGDLSDSYYFISHFLVDTDKDGRNDLALYIDTSTGKPISFPNTNLSTYTADANYPNQWTLSNPGQYVTIQKAWIDYGTKVEVNSNQFQITVPDKQRKIEFQINGTGTSSSNTWTFDTSNLISRFISRFGGGNSTELKKTLRKAELPYLIDKGFNQMQNATVYKEEVTENISIIADALFDNMRPIVGNLVSYVTRNKAFSYTITFKEKGLPLVNDYSVGFQSGDFIAGNRDHIVVPLFGGNYTLTRGHYNPTQSEIILSDSSGNRLRLVDGQAFPASLDVNALNDASDDYWKAEFKFK